MPKGSRYAMQHGWGIVATAIALGSSGLFGPKIQSAFSVVASILGSTH